jgi:hypothetical protein
MEIQERGFVFKVARPIEKTAETDRRFSKKEEEIEEEKKKSDPITEGPFTSYRTPLLQSISLSSKDSASRGKQKEMIDAMTKPIVAAAKQGIGKTHVIIETKSLSSIEVMIDHYDTDPYSFYIRLMGDKQAQGFFQKNRLLLAAGLRSALPSFHCTLAPFSFRPRSFLSERQRKNSLVKSSDLSYREDKEVERS